MSLSQWTTVAGSNIVTSIETTSPLGGTGSLRIARNGASASASFTYPDDVALPTGLIKGRLQTQFQLLSVTSDGGQDQRFTMYFMIDTLTSPLTAAQMYGFSAVFRVGNGITGFELGKATGSQNVAGQLGTFNVVPDIAIGQTITMQVDWVYDLLQFSGTQIKARYNIGTSFTGMTEIFNLIDGVSPLSFSFAEAIGVVTPGISNFVVLCDETSLYDMIAV